MEIFNRFLKHGKLERKQHQYDAVEWCLERERNSTHQGGILADEMGLGKTIVMLGLLLCNYQRHTLVVLPVVLINQWREKIENTIGHEAIVFYGSERKRITNEELEKAPLIITSYTTLLVDSKKDKRIANRKWDRVIFDEAHYMRNPKSKIYKHVKKMNIKIRWMLTATPLQNKRGDFYALCRLLKFTLKDILNDENENFIETIMLRRTKEDVGLDNIKVHTKFENIGWTPVEEELGQEYHDGFHFSNLRREGRRLPGHEILKQMLRAKQLCVQPSLVPEASFVTDTSKIDNIINKIVERKNNGNRKIIFSHFRGEIDTLRDRLHEHSFSVAAIDGRTSKKQKQLILANDYDVLLLQLKVGSEGLNLQQYNEIYFVSPSWNPFMEDQAVGRCNRIGQEKDVYVYRFSMNHLTPYERIEDIVQGKNIENYSYGIQKQKKELFHQLFN